MCCRLISAILIFWQAAIGNTLRVDAVTEMDSAQCAHWFSALGTKMQGVKRMSYNHWFRYFQETGKISNTLLFGEVQPAFRDQMIEAASDQSESLNAITQGEFVTWCLEHGDSFKLKHSTIESAVEELLEVEEQLDPIKQALLQKMEKGGTFSKILKTLNKATYSTNEIKDELYRAMTETWQCLTHLGRFTTQEALTTREEVIEMLDLWDLAVHKKGGLFPMHNDYTFCEAWDSETLDQVDVAPKSPSKNKVSHMWSGSTSYTKTSAQSAIDGELNELGKKATYDPRSRATTKSTVQGSFPSIQNRLQQFGN